MESMVRDPSIDKVLMICDRHYVEKADSRQGGVGIETTIISSELYGEVNQNKFIAIVVEKDEAGKPCLPVYYRSRKYIDFSDDERYASNFEGLLRSIYGKPQFIKPELAQHPPSFVTEDESNISLGTDTAFRLAKQAVIGGKDNADGLISSYLELYSNNLEKLRLEVGDNISEFPNQVVDSINNFIPDRNQFIEIVKIIAQYRNTEVIKDQIHKFFETLLPYLYTPQDIKQEHQWDYDNYKFIIEELFLCCIAILIKYNRFNIVSILVNQDYYCLIPYYRNLNPLHNFSIFRQSIPSLEDQNSQHYRATLLKDRFQNNLIKFADLQQVDFLLFLIDAQKTLTKLHPDQKWFPDTIIYKDLHFDQEFEIFNRAKSKTYFDSMKSIFDIETKDELTPLFEAFVNNSLRSFQYDITQIKPSFLVNYQELCTRPLISVIALRIYS